MSEILRDAILLLSGAGAVSCALVAWRIWRGNALEYERNRRRVGSLRNAIRGEIPTVFDGTRDYRVSAGVGVDTKTNQRTEQGRLSAEAISSALRPPSL
jgi:hypothetical protein